jgi:uncharacterized protein
LESSRREHRVRATPAALEMIERLTAEHGPLRFLLSGGCCDGSSPLCARRDELPVAVNDRLLGEIGGAQFYADTELYERWNEPRLIVDMSPGSGDSFSLEGRHDSHFVLVPPDSVARVGPPVPAALSPGQDQDGAVGVIEDLAGDAADE